MTGFAFIAGLVVGALAGMWIAQHREYVPTTEEQLVRRVYRHLDEIIGATKNENQIRADLRFRMIHPRLHLLRPWRNWPWLIPNWKRAPLRTKLANYFWPVPHLAPGSNPLPADKRIAHYIRHSADLRTWWVHYTAEAPANHAPFIEWLTRGLPRQGGGLAQALGLEWRPDLFVVERNWSASEVKLTVNGAPRRAPAVPAKLPASEEFDGAR